MHLKQFTEIPSDGFFPLLDELPLLMQDSVHRLSNLSSVVKINASRHNNTIRLNIFFKPQNAYLQVGQLWSSIDKESLTTDYLNLAGPKNQATIHLKYKRVLLN